MCTTANGRFTTDGRRPRYREGFQIVIWILVIINLLSVLVCCQIAKSRMADRWYWSLAGLVFGPFAIPFAFFSSPTRSARKGSDEE